MTTPNNRPETCGEYLGQRLGYCSGAAQLTDRDGRGFCTDHARMRDL